MTKTKTYLLASIVSVLVLAVGVTFAYFTVQIEGTGKAMTVNTANLRVIFEDTNAAISATNIKPGTTIPSKTFTVESKTDAEYKYDIVIKNLVNTFVTEGYLQYKIIGSGGGISQDWTDIPKSATATDTVLVHSVPLAVNAKHTYTVNFRYLNSDSVDQSADMGKSFSGSIMITEGTTAPTWAYTTSSTSVYLNQAMPTGISYPTAAEARAQLNRPYYNKHLVENGIVTESYVEFIVTDADASAYSGMTAGTYALKGADASAYNANKQVLDTAFGSSHCSESGSGNDAGYSCSVPYYFFYYSVKSSGSVNAYDMGIANCSVNSGGDSGCYNDDDDINPTVEDSPDPLADMPDPDAPDIP